MDWHLGTMGFGYPDWVGPFYPRGTKSTDYLSYYAKHLNAVELDTTFYAAPSADRVAKWAAAVPEDFVFCAKTPREITHDRPLGGSVKPMLRFLDAMRQMGRKLGVVLLQFPPGFGVTEFVPLRTFLLSMPPDIRLAVEFRNSSWRRPETGEMLREVGCGWAATDNLGNPEPIHVTVDYLYVRWIGVHRRYAAHSRERVDMTDRLGWWKARIDDVSVDIRSVYGFFNNDYAGYSIGTCRRFAELIGMPAGPVPTGQGALFG